jgi:hypothetical protein
MVMFTMTIESNHDKLTRDGIYSVEEFDALLRKICLDTDFKESSPGHYVLDDSADELGRMLVLDVKFDKLGYIVPNLKTWLTESDDEGTVDQLAG